MEQSIKKEKKKEQTFAKKRERNIFEKTNSSITLKLQKGIYQKSGSNKRPWCSIKQDSVCWFHLRKIRGTEDGWNAVPSRLRRLHVYIGMEHPHAWITS